jgi:hypothetical protein
MSTLSSFMGQFGGQGEEAAPLDSNLVPASSPNALGTFMEQFTTLTESYFFYNHTVELRFNVADHKYYRVMELGNLVEVGGVTTALKNIDKSNALVPWAAKKCAEKILRTIPLSCVPNEFNELMLSPITLTDFTKLVMEAKNAHKELLVEAGDIGHLAHKCLEDSIQYAIDHTGGVVHELKGVPEDEKAKACAEAGFAWMQAHSVLWIKTEKKIYSLEHNYAGTLDGKCWVSSCDDPSCCSEHFINSLSIADWKSSNALHVEYIFQVAGAYCHAEVEEFGEDIQNCFILRLGKNEEEAGKFEPWRVPAKDFPEAFQGFLTCLTLGRLLGSTKDRMSTQKKGVREIKKQQRAEQKTLDKEKVKAQRAQEKAQLKLDRAAEKERIKAEAKKNREELKSAPKVAVVQLSVPMAEAKLRGEGRPACELIEESLEARKPFVIPEEG